MSAVRGTEAVREALRTELGLTVRHVRAGQTLWAGYGRILFVDAADAGGARRRLVVKEVNPPRGGGGSGSVGHSRKLRSYEAEAAFYSALLDGSSPVAASAAAGCPLPEPLLVRSSLDGGDGGSMLLVLSDLTDGFPVQGGSLTFDQAAAAFRWLAAFHAAHWERPLPSGLWPEGCYWHLATRQEELEAIPPEWADLRAVAERVDAELAGDAGGAFRTVLQGDFKSANLLFSAAAGDDLRCAAYDMQYCGGGFGAKDVAKLIATSVGRDAVAREAELLDVYHSALVARLPPAAAAAYTRDVLERHYALALVDFARFAAGWGWWGNVEWLRRRTKRYIKELHLLD